MVLIVVAVHKGLVVVNKSLFDTLLEAITVVVIVVFVDVENENSCNFCKKKY